jgi:hypothetical protein
MRAPLGSDSAYLPSASLRGQAGAALAGKPGFGDGSPAPDVRGFRQQDGGTEMGRRDELIAVYASELRDTCGITPDMELLTKVTLGLGPSIYRDDAAMVAASDPDELQRIRANYLVKKLGLSAGPALEAGIEQAIETYGRGNRNKHRAVFYYLLTKHFGREAAYA